VSTAESKVVLFADVLGFASLVETCPLDPSLLKMQARPLSATIDSILQVGGNDLIRTFSGFHETLKWALFSADMRHQFTAISFSDSVFIATQYAHEAIGLAAEILQSLIARKIPARIGIGFGSFAAIRFKSDITPDSGDHAAQFLGTSVVYACAAEKCGVKGLRILLHPSVMPLLSDPQHNPASSGLGKRVLQCHENESGNTAGVRHEIDYWRLAPTKEASTWKALQDMWDKAPASEVIHYEATVSAINRMRVAQGHPPITKIRQRTLKRKAVK